MEKADRGQCDALDTDKLGYPQAVSALEQRKIMKHDMPLSQEHESARQTE
jgi:hypothetical protein